MVGFHISITIGYVEEVPFFCDTTETIKVMVNNNMRAIKDAPNHPLKGVV